MFLNIYLYIFLVDYIKIVLEKQSLIERPLFNHLLNSNLHPARYGYIKLGHETLAQFITKWESKELQEQAGAEQCQA